MKKKPLIQRLIPWVLLVAVLGVIGYVGYLLWGQPEAAPAYTAEIVRYEGDYQEPLVLDNGKIHLEMDPETTQFVLTDAFGHEWKSNPFSDPAASGETIASGENRNALASPLNIYYRLPKKAVDNLYDAYTYSVSRSAYQIRKIDDSTLEVTYSIGDIAREFVLPETLIKDRYDELTDAVKAAGVSKKQFTGKYTGRKSGTVRDNLTGEKKDKREEAAGLMNAYPQLALQDIYTINVDDNNNLQSLADLLGRTGYTEEDMRLDTILSRSSYRYSYHLYTPEEIAALRQGSEEDQQLAGKLLEIYPALSERNGYIFRREGQVVTPAGMEELLAGSEEQIAYANQILDAFPEAQSEPFTVMPVGQEQADRLYTAEELLDEAFYSEGERLLEKRMFEAAEKPVSVLFDVTVRYRLDGNDFVAEVPYSELKYNSANASLSYISLLPMFGAVGAGEDGTYEKGWLLVPEGGGALIGFNNQEFSQSGYSTDVYGYDYGIKRDEFITEPKVYFPLFGILRENQSFFCVVEDGSSFVSIRADINGNETGTERSSYNYANAKVQVIHLDHYNVSAKTSELQLMYEKRIPNQRIVQRYRFTDSGDYARLASAYGDYLRETYPELKEKQSSEDVPVSVELIGAIDKRVVVAGLPVQKVVPTTTFGQAGDILGTLRESGVRNLNARVAGWLKGGVKQKTLTGVRVLNELGGEKGAEALMEKARSYGIPLYFDGITAFAYDSGLLDGFVAARDAARYITREVNEISRYSPVFYTEEDDDGSFYLVRPEYARENASRLISWLKRKGADGIAFRDIGFMLSADYNPNRTTDRETVRRMNIGTLKEAREAGRKVMIKGGFDFTLPYADLVTDMDLSGKRYILLDRYIPFYQIAIHGMTDYTGKPLNLEGDYQTELLRSVEYGAGLNFTFMAENASVTQETRYTGLYGATYADWEREAVDAILRYQREAAGLNRQRIVGHEELSDDVRMTVYEDGTRVFVNYGTKEYRGDITVPARDYAIAGKEGQ